MQVERETLFFIFAGSCVLLPPPLTATLPHCTTQCNRSAIRPSELVGEAWTKKDKEVLAPNVLAMINRSTMVTNWVVRSVIECPDLHERAAVFSLLCEVSGCGSL
jgi:hypothetical protein